jgi:hypothetical protein
VPLLSTLGLLSLPLHELSDDEIDSCGTRIAQCFHGDGPTVYCGECDFCVDAVTEENRMHGCVLHRDLPPPCTKTTTCCCASNR